MPLDLNRAVKMAGGAPETLNVFDLAFLVNGLAVLISTQLDP
jgi:hypothetical protein